MAKRIALEGNQGGDVFEIQPLPDGRVRLQVASCCVREIDHIVPVEFLTSLLVQAVLDAGGVTEAMQSINWPKEFLEKLVSQIEHG